MDPRLDFRQSVPPRQSYIVASSYRSGSTFFCAELMKTGVLGAPGEYLNVGDGRRLRDVMMRRLGATAPEVYFAKLLGVRTSRNGVFGMKAHFPHFEAALTWYPEMLQTLAPVTFIYLFRNDTLAQAVSLARAVKTDAWSTMDGDGPANLVYDGPLIAQCLKEVAQQKIGWSQWFERNHIRPFVVHYEDLIADTAGVVRSVVELLGVGNDEPEEVCIPTITRQADNVNLDWHAHFREAAPDWESWFPIAPPR
jgi:trehalose 2-sulfotransferase